MSIGQEMRDFVDAAEAGIRMQGNWQNMQAQRLKNKQAPGWDDDVLPPSSFGGDGGPGVGTNGAPQVEGQPKGGKGRDIAWKNASPEQRAFLMTLSGPESAGDYTVRFGGNHFTDFSRHPGKAGSATIDKGPNKGKTSSAAGRYQFIEGTWNNIASKYHITDFSPESQDMAAWYLATEEYGRQTKRDLASDLKSGDPNIIAGIGKALRGQWTSLPGGIEQGTNTDAFVSSYTNFLKNGPTTPYEGPSGGGTAQPAQPAQPAEAQPAETQPAPMEEPQPQPDDPNQQVQIDVPEAIPPEITPVVVADEFTPEEYYQNTPGLYEEGGAIPDDYEEETQNFQGGGMPINPDQPANPSGNPDPYNANRAYTQPVPQQPAAAVARRIKLPTGAGTQGVPDWRSWGNATPAQTQLRTSQANLAAQRAAAAAAPVAAAKPAEETPKKLRIPPLARTSGHTFLTPEDMKGQFRRGHGVNFGANSREKGGMVYENFAKGGPVAKKQLPDRDRRFQELLAMESRGAGSQHGGGDSARDRAAKRLSREEGRPTSSAYSPSRPSNKFPPAPKTGQPRSRLPGTAPIPTPRPDQKTGEPRTPWETREPPDRSVRGKTWPPGWEKAGEHGRTGPKGWDTDQGTSSPPGWDEKRKTPSPPGWEESAQGGKSQPGNKSSGQDFLGKAKIDIPETKKQKDEEEDRGFIRNYFGFAKGGAIPDDDGGGRDPLWKKIVRGGKAKPDLREFKRKAGTLDEDEAPATKTSTKKKPRSTTKKQQRKQAKPGKKKTGKPRSGLPSKAPVPKSRPGSEQFGPPVPAYDLGLPETAPRPGERPEQFGPPVPPSSPVGPGGTPPATYRPPPTGPGGTPPATYRPPTGPGGTPPASYNAPPVAKPYQPPPTGPGGTPPATYRQPTGPGGTPPASYNAPPVAKPYQPPPPQQGPPQPRQPGPIDEQGGYLDWARAGLGAAAGAAGDYLSDAMRPGAWESDYRPQQGPPQPPPEVPYDESLEETPWLGNGYGYARGGAIPDEDQFPKAPAGGAGYGASPAEGPVAGQRGYNEHVARGGTARTQAEPPQSDVPFEQAAQSAMPAIKQGMAGIARIFGIGGQQGAIETPESAAAQDAGIRRFAQHEGAATKQELQAIDFATGVDQIQADEGTKNLIRLDRTVQWHLQRGDKEKAEFVAASLLLYGAQAVSRAGVMAQTAFQRYQQTGDPQDFRNASLAVQRAHQLIPDGLNMKIDIDPKTRQIVATTVNSEGKQEKHVVDPAQIPGLLKSAMDGSAYWDAMYSVGQPRLAEQKLSNAASGSNRQEERDWQLQFDEYKNERELKEKMDAEERAAATEEYRHGRDTAEGRSAEERKKRVADEFYVDWGERMGAATTPEEKQKVLEEGLDYTYQNARSRQEPLADADIQTAALAAVEAGTINEEDQPFMINLARMLGAKNELLDEAGAVSAAAALITQPTYNTAYGQLNVGGMDLVFNPVLLPPLRQLRTKYAQAAQ